MRSNSSLDLSSKTRVQGLADNFSYPLQITPAGFHGCLDPGLLMRNKLQRILRAKLGHGIGCAHEQERGELGEKYGLRENQQMIHAVF